ncbi:MAG: hypothetical protein Q7T01_02920 [bacterium]|nr:hypothetical protein [bacterium]
MSPFASAMYDLGYDAENDQRRDHQPVTVRRRDSGGDGRHDRRGVIHRASSNQNSPFAPSEEGVSGLWFSNVVTTAFHTAAAASPSAFGGRETRKRGALLS